ncbi:GM24760 [Drosophila sechellia]|uniref:GM24760 n=1 Tax=Drosophila sechellia TaxID=7238 RepID=B4HEC6_DROSE|nr:GM24760 [Drosophila sechellia]
MGKCFSSAATAAWLIRQAKQLNSCPRGRANVNSHFHQSARNDKRLLQQQQPQQQQQQQQQHPLQ